MKLFVPLVISWVCLWAITGLSIYEKKTARFQDRQDTMKYAGEIALSIVKEYAALVDGGKISLQDAQKQAMERIRHMRFGADGYFTIVTSKPSIVMHPVRRELDEKDMSDYKDPAGHYLFRELAAIARGSGKGWVEYVAPKPGHSDRTAVFAKGSYVITYKPWDWSLVTGVYLDDLSDQVVSDFWRGLGVLTCIGIFMSGALYLVIRSVERTIGGDPDLASEVAHQIAAGDLTQVISIRNNDTSSLCFAIKSMQESLLSIVSRVRTGTDAISSASLQIAAGNMDLATRTAQQAASLEETASSMEELTSTVKQNADNACQANSLAMAASVVAVNGGKAVAEVVEIMSVINDSAKEIASIISVIDSIAFQTNILALNASVEAARAGEQGRGFAVVASEVRSLAHRSATAAKEIKSLIDDSLDGVHAGTRLVDQAGATMENVVNSVCRVTSIIGEIAVASDEQTSGIAQVNTAIAQIDTMAQQNAALVEESAAAATSMRSQAGELARVVSVFKLV
jgi:methyl-accepting chemotaxis protein